MSTVLVVMGTRDNDNSTAGIRACDLSGALSKDEQQIAGEQVFEETTCDPAIVFAVKSELMCVTA